MDGQPVSFIVLLIPSVMNWIKRLFSAGSLFGLCYTISAAQPQGSGQMEFPEIRMYFSQSQFNRLKSNRGVKMELKKVVMLMDQDTAAIKELHSRGLTSSQFERKSMSVDLKQAVRLKNNNQKMKRFDLINLAMDQYLWHNRWAFLSMSQLQIFPLFNTFCKVWINGEHQGIYLLVEKPNYYMDKVESPFMIRRGYNHKIDKAYSKGDNKKENAKLTKQYESQYESIYHDLSQYHGEVLFSKLSDLMVMEHYLGWLSFNYWVMNGDYSDELFLYIQPGSGLFDIIPWDYDDLLKRQPHEGWDVRNQSLANKLIFSAEETMDQAIVSDDFLYRKYLSCLKNTLLQLSPEKLKATMDQVIRELASLAKDEEGVMASRYLDKFPFELEKAQTDIARTYDFLVYRRNTILLKLSGK